MTQPIASGADLFMEQGVVLRPRGYLASEDGCAFRQCISSLVRRRYTRRPKWYGNAWERLKFYLSQ